MTIISKASIEAQIHRWLRHDWRRYVQRGSKLEKLYEEIERKYRPDQARVSAGSPGGGQWTDEDGNVAPSSNANPDSSRGRSDPGASSDAASGYSKLAQNEPSRGYPVDLREEDRRGGHTVEEHVGKSQSYLLSRVRREAAEADRVGWAEGLRAGSFTSLAAANKLVNSTLAADASKPTIDQVVSGRLQAVIVKNEFSSSTGYEAYAANERSQPYVRSTNGVAVLIVHDSTSERGYRVHTAYPINIGR